jgi:hypothetical protein
LLKWHGPGARSFRPFQFRGCGLRAACPPARQRACARPPTGCNSRQPHPFFTGCASARGRVSKTQLTPGGTEAACHFSFGVVADKQCTCFASRLMWERYPPTPPAFAVTQWRRGCRAVVRRTKAGRTIKPGSDSASQFRLRETRPKYREKPHKLLQVGVTPTPATHYLRRATKGSDPAARL